MSRSVSRTLAACLAALSTLAASAVTLTAASVAVGAPAPYVSVTAPSYDAPGAAVATVVTVTNVPAGYTIAALVGRVGTGAVSCESFRWAHGASVSQKCYVSLPSRAGSWTLRGTATLTKAGAATRVYAGATVIKTKGPATHAVSSSVRAQITKCYNTTNKVRLTFDDGYSTQANLNSILYTLKANNVRGRFFLLGSWATSHAAMVHQIKAAGHYVENHTNTHQALSSVSNATVNSEIVNGQRSNHGSPMLLRPPYGAGAYTARLYNLAAARGYKLCHWGVESADWSGISAAAIVNKTVRGDALTPPARAGDSILMHLTNTNTRYALPGLIKALHAKGLNFERLRL